MPNLQHKVAMELTFENHYLALELGEKPGGVVRVFVVVEHEPALLLQPQSSAACV